MQVRSSRIRKVSETYELNSQGSIKMKIQYTLNDSEKVGGSKCNNGGNADYLLASMWEYLINIAILQNIHVYIFIQVNVVGQYCCLATFLL